MNAAIGEDGGRLLKQSIMELQPQLVSFDIFDTLVWRPFRQPKDLFLHLPAALAHGGASVKVNARTLARRRVDAEQRARRRSGTPEVTLQEIMEELCRDLDSTGPASLAEAELLLESEHLHPHPDLLSLVADLHEEGIPYALCSDMYLPSASILKFLREGAQRVGVILPEPRAVLISGERRSGKSGGLFDMLAKETGINPSRIVHLGDNPEADVVCARRRGVHALHIPRTCPVAEEVLDAEEDWMPEATRASRDFGLSTSRKQILAEMTLSPATLASPRAYGAFVSGPVLAAFASWVVGECRRRGITRLHCAMREGVFLSRLLSSAAEALGYPLDIRRIWASRFAFRSAALAESTTGTLIEFLVNLRSVDLRADLLCQIGLLDGRTEAGWMAARMDEADLANKLAWVRQLLEENPAILGDVRRRASQRRSGLVEHLRRNGLIEESSIHLVDIGWGGSIQAGLAACLQHEGWAGTVDGIYLGTNQLINRLDSARCSWISYLYREGLPLEAARVVQRTPELLEQTCMSPDGSLREFTAEGDPVLFENSIPKSQLEDVAAMQDGIMEFGRLWWPRFVLSGAVDASPDEAAAFEDRLRAVITRSIMDPRAEEVALFSDWQHDSNNGSGESLRVLGTEEAALLVRSGKVTHPWQLDWQTSYWPQGLFAAEGRRWNLQLAGRTRLLVRTGALSARLFGRFDPWPKVLRAWLALRLRLRDLKHAALARRPRLPQTGRT
jgi:FMN phosphatase YigB (HAD superfamily)